MIRFPLHPDREAPTEPLGTRSRLGHQPERFLFCPHIASFTPATLPTRTFPDKRLSVPLCAAGDATKRPRPSGFSSDTKYDADRGPSAKRRFPP